MKRVARNEMVPVHPLALFGLGGWRPEMTRTRAETVVAVNVGGFLIPTGLATYEVLRLARTHAVPALLGAVLLNVAVCYVLARRFEAWASRCPA